MALFIVRITRDYSISEGFERIIEADTEEQAEAAADALAVYSDMNCPDDCSEEGGGGDIGAGNFGVDKFRDYEGPGGADLVAADFLLEMAE
jgi:hypothetical protein